MTIKSRISGALVAGIASLAMFQSAPALAGCSSSPFIGSICLAGFNFCPRGYAPADGQLVAISSNPALFSLLGTIYGGDGRTTFALPDLRGRAPIHQGTGPGLGGYPIGSRGGQERVTLTTQQMPSHTHQARAQSGDGDSPTPVDNVWSDDLGVSSATYSSAGVNANMSGAAIDSTGGSQSHENRPPYLTMQYCIAVTGIFPSRS